MDQDAIAVWPRQQAVCSEGARNEEILLVLVGRTLEIGILGETLSHASARERDKGLDKSLIVDGIASAIC